MISANDPTTEAPNIAYYPSGDISRPQFLMSS